ACNIAAWTRQAGNKAAGDRIGHPCKDNWQRARGLLQCRYHKAIVAEEQIWIERDQFRRDCPRPPNIDRGPAHVHAKIASFVPSQVLKYLPKRSEMGLPFHIRFVPADHHADAPHPPVLLRPRRQRTGGSAAEEGNELATPHCVDPHSTT